MPIRARLALLPLLILSLCSTSFATLRAADVPTVFAAASLTNAMEAVGAAYRAKTGKEMRFSFASSSTLARQIEAGAPAQIFVSANERWMDYLAQRNLVERNTRTSPIGNRLALIAPSESKIPPHDVTAASDLSGLLGAGARLAVGDPGHVPAGIYAKEALETLGFWPALEPRLARADNVRAALALVERGESPLGIVYSTDAAIARGVKVLGLFPRDSHKPITYPFAILAHQETNDVTAAFSFLTGADAIGIYERFGFFRTD